MQGRMGRDRRGPTTLGEILGRYLGQPGLQPKIKEIRILEAWNGLVGKTIGEVTQAVRVRNRSLQVKVTHPAWMQEIQFHKKRILQKVNEFLGEDYLQDLRLVLGEKESESCLPTKRTEGPNPRRALQPAEGERIWREVMGVRDAEMREALFRLFAKGLTTERRPSAGGKKGG